MIDSAMATDATDGPESAMDEHRPDDIPQPVPQVQAEGMAHQSSGGVTVLSEAPVRPPWSIKSYGKGRLQAQIIRLLSYAPVFNHGDGEFHEWDMVYSMLDAEAKDNMPTDMLAFLQGVKAQYPDFDFKMNGSQIVMVAFTKTAAPEPTARNYVTQKAMHYAQRFNVREVTIESLLKYADPGNCFQHKPGDFIRYMQKDTARFALVMNEDPFKVLVRVSPHMNLTPKSLRHKDSTGWDRQRAVKRARVEDNAGGDASMPSLRAQLPIPGWPSCAQPLCKAHVHRSQ